MLNILVHTLKQKKEINKSVIATEVERKKGAFRIVVLSNSLHI